MNSDFASTSYKNQIFQNKSTYQNNKNLLHEKMLNNIAYQCFRIFFVSVVFTSTAERKLFTLYQIKNGQ